MDYFKNWDEVIQSVKGRPGVKRVAVAAAGEEHTLEAVTKVMRDGLVDPLLVGDKAEIARILKRLGTSVSEENIYDKPDFAEAAAFAVQLVHEGKADFLMKGMLDTSILLRAVVNKETGLGTGKLMCIINFLVIPRYHKMLVVTDAGMVMYPTLEQKKALIETAVSVLRNMGYAKPKVAVLAAIEKVNPKMPETVEADALKQMNLSGEIADCIVEGPISMDLAMTKSISATKKYDSPVAGNPDILIFPNIQAGNIAIKTMTELAGAVSAGVVVGAKVPIVLTSRGASSEEKYLSLVLAAGSAGKQ